MGKAGRCILLFLLVWSCCGEHNILRRKPFLKSAMNEMSYSMFEEFVSSQKNVSFVNVYDFGAFGDGVHDDTNAFQSAINAMIDGGIVFAPRGQFRFDGTIRLLKGVTIEGTWRSVPSHEFVGGEAPTTGSVLLPYFGRGNENATAFITMVDDSVLRGLVIYYPEQLPKGLPVQYPWTIDMTGNNPAVIDVECLNCFNAIHAVGAQRHYISRFQGQPINIGIYIDETYDIGRVENVHFNPWFSVDKTFLSWQLTYGKAFVIARTDWEYFLNTFAFGYAIGYHFIESSTGSCNGNFLGIGADMMANASVLIDASDPWGILITNGEFTSFVDPQFGSMTPDSTQIVVSSTNSGSLKLSNTAFWGPSNQIAKIAGSGSVSFSNCIFNQWDSIKQGRFAIQVTGSGSLIMQASEFQQDGNQIVLDKGLQRAVIVGNLLTGTKRIQNNGVLAYEEGFNAAW